MSKIKGVESVTRKINLAGAEATLYGHVTHALRTGYFNASICMRYNDNDQIIVKQAGAGFNTEIKAWQWCVAAIDSSSVFPMEVR